MVDLNEGFAIVDVVADVGLVGAERAGHHLHRATQTVDGTTEAPSEYIHDCIVDKLAVDDNQCVLGVVILGAHTICVDRTSILEHAQSN